MVTLNFEKKNGHILLKMNDLNLLIDTGSPVSIANNHIRFLNKTYNTLRSMMGTNVETLSNLSGFKIDALIGNDILSNYKFRIRWNECCIDFGDDLPDGRIVQKMINLMGIIFPVNIDGEGTLAIFDTGAFISYISEDKVAGKTPIETREDFYPVIGKFTTPIYKVPLTIDGNNIISMDFGTLPGVLKMMHGMIMSVTKTKAVLGTQLLEVYNCTIDWKKNKISWD